MKLNFTLRIVSDEDRKVFKEFATVCPLMWDTSISIDASVEDAFEVLITDSVDEVVKALQNARPHSETIFLGDMAQVENWYKMLLDVWPLNEKPELRRVRFEKLLRNLQTRFDAWHYNNMLTTMIDSIPELIWFKDSIGAHMLVNREFCNTVHKTKEDIRGRGHYYIWDISEEEYKKGEFVCMESEEETMKAGKTCIFDEPLKTSEGMKQLKTYKTPLYDMFGKIEGTVGVAHDVTDFGNMGLELSILVENIPFPLILCDIEWHTLKMNDTFKKLVGLKDSAINTFVYKDWLHRNMVPVGEERVKAGGNAHEREFVLNIDGQAHYYIVIEQEIIDYFQNVSGYFVILRDVTMARNYERMILNEANTDALTGLYNRRYFEDFVCNNAGRPMTLLYMDLDRFKEINDNFGHRRGDEILRGAAKFMLECFPDGIVSRMGGDEFTVILERIVSEDEAREKCEELDAKIRTLFRAGGLHISISFGMSVNNGDRNIEELLHEADEHMYELKKIRHAER